MKKIKYLILALLLMLPITGQAAVIHCNAPATVESGETFEVTFYGSIGGQVPFWYARLAGQGNASYSSGNLTISGVESGDMSQTVYYTAGNPGTATFYAYDVSVSDGESEYDDSDTCYVEIVEATAPNGPDDIVYNYDDEYDDDYTEVEVDPDKSGNNYLKSLELEGVKLSPSFDKEKLEYTAAVEGKLSKINIKAELEDGTATLEGTGEKELEEGLNRFNIKVTAENNEVRSYTVTVTRKEADPIEITIDKKKYTVAKKEIGLKVPEGFSKTTVVINKQEVVAYSNKETGYILVALTDENGKNSWYIYNEKNSSYTKYSELKSDGLRIVILKPNKSDIPYNYKPLTFLINDEEVEGYALEYNSSYRLIYGLNIKNGKKAFYLYDTEEKTFQRFYGTQVEIYRDLVKKLEIAGIGLIALVIILIVIVISQIVVKRKIKRFISNPNEKNDRERELSDIIKEDEEIQKEEVKEEKIKKETKKKTIDNELTKTVKLELANEYQDQKPLTKKELKQKLKEEKKELKKAKKEFLDE